MRFDGSYSWYLSPAAKKFYLFEKDGLCLLFPAAFACLDGWWDLCSKKSLFWNVGQEQDAERNRSVKRMRSRSQGKIKVRISIDTLVHVFWTGQVSLLFQIGFYLLLPVAARVKRSRQFVVAWLYRRSSLNTFVPGRFRSNKVSMFSIDYCPLFGFAPRSSPNGSLAQAIATLRLFWCLFWANLDELLEFVQQIYVNVSWWSSPALVPADCCKCCYHTLLHYYNPFCMVAKDVYSKTQHNAIALMFLFSLRATNHIQSHPNSIKFCFILHLDSFRAPKSQTQAFSKHESFTENSGLLLSAPWWTSTALSMSWLACQGQVALTMPRGLRTNPPASSPH